MSFLGCVPYYSIIMRSVFNNTFSVNRLINYHGNISFGKPAQTQLHYITRLGLESFSKISWIQISCCCCYAGEPSLVLGQEFDNTDLFCINDCS